MPHSDPSLLPAFPTPIFFDERPEGLTPGMSLRDYFAAMVMPTIYFQADRGATKLGIAFDAYDMADAMLAVRAMPGHPTPPPPKKGD